MKEIIYVDMDGVLCDFSTKFYSKRIPGTMEYPQSQPRFFENLEEIPLAVSSMTLLKELGYDVWILTAPSVYNALCYTEKRIWVEEHLGFDWCYKLILSPDKSLLIGDYLVDDIDHDPHKARQEAFTGKLIKFGPGNEWAEITQYFAGKITEDDDEQETEKETASRLLSKV